VESHPAYTVVAPRPTSTLDVIESAFLESASLVRIRDGRHRIFSENLEG
jgi:hypothetical protein